MSLYGLEQSVAEEVVCLHFSSFSFGVPERFNGTNVEELPAFSSGLSGLEKLYSLSAPKIKIIYSNGIITFYHGQSLRIIEAEKRFGPERA
jgi:hypothetical protein